MRTKGNWRFLAGIAIALACFVALVAAFGPDTVTNARLVIRWTARFSLVLFVLAFTAAPLARLLPSTWTDWHLRTRREFGLSFALSHFVHLGAILVLATSDSALFWSLTPTITLVGGTLAYVLIAFLALTSFGRIAALMSRPLWRRLHRAGIWYVWLAFVFTFGRRAVFDTDYWPAMVVLFWALAIRLLGRPRTEARIGESFPAGKPPVRSPSLAGR